MTILLINFTCHSSSQKSNLGTAAVTVFLAFDWTDAFLYNGANESAGVIFCLDSKTINTLTKCPIKSILGQTTSECVCVGRLEGAGSSNNNKSLAYSNKTLLG